MKHGFSFVLFNQQTQSLFTNTMFFFVLCSISHACANPLCFLKWFLCFDGPYTVFILIYPHWFLLYPFKKSVGFVSFFSPMQHSHIHTIFKHYHEQDGMIEKQNFVECHHWLMKIGEKKQDEMEKNELCGHLQCRRHGRIGHWVRKIPADQNTGNIEGNSVFRAIIVASW